MDKVEADLVYGTAEWPVQVHHVSRDLWWRVLEVIEPETPPPQPATAGRYVLKVHGPFWYLPGRVGQLYIAAARHGDRWLIEPDASAYPRRGRRPELGNWPTGIRARPRGARLSASQQKCSVKPAAC